MAWNGFGFHFLLQRWSISPSVRPSHGTPPALKQAFIFFAERKTWAGILRSCYICSVLFQEPVSFPFFHAVLKLHTWEMQTIQNREEWWIHRMGVLPVRGISTGQRRGSTRSLRRTAKGNTKSCIWRRNSPHLGIDKGLTSSAEKVVGVCKPVMVPLCKRPTGSWIVLGGGLPAGRGKWFFLFTEHWWDASVFLGLGLRFPVPEKVILITTYSWF